MQSEARAAHLTQDEARSLMNKLRVSALPGRFAVIRVEPDADLAPLLPRSRSFWSLTRTAEEVSLVVAEEELPPLPADARVESGWRTLKVEGPLPFETTGLVRSLTQPLAKAKISVFVISTFDTDYLLVKDERFEAALDVLAQSFSVTR
jgi:hypothetical protein